MREVPLYLLQGVCVGVGDLHAELVLQEHPELQRVRGWCSNLSAICQQFVSMRQQFVSLRQQFGVRVGDLHPELVLQEHPELQRV